MAFKKTGKGSGSLNMITDTVKDSLDGIDATCETATCADNKLQTSTVKEEYVAPTSSVAPPYSYASTDAASCKELESMIYQTKDLMTRARFTSEGLTVYQNWLSYAENRYATQCQVKPADPVIPIDKPTTLIPVDDVQTFPVTDPKIPVATDKPTTTDSPSSSLDGPASVPYSASAPSGGGGGGGSEEPAAKPVSYKNWFWVVTGVTFVVGYFLKGSGSAKAATP